MHSPPHEHSGYGFAVGLLAGTCVGAAIALWLAPRSAAELRGRVSDTATRIGQRASDRYQQAAHQVGKAVGELTRKGQDVRDEVAQAVATLENEGSPPVTPQSFPAAVGHNSSRNATG